MRHLMMALVITAVGAAQAATQCPEAERARLEALDRAWGDATMRGDRAHLQQLFAEDYVSVGMFGTTGKVTVIDNALAGSEAARRAPEAAPRTTYHDYHITCTPQTAMITHWNTTTRTVGGEEHTALSRSVHVLERRSGRWQVVADAGHMLDDATVLRRMESAWNDAARTRDTAWFARNFADDASQISARTGRLMNKAEAIASMRSDRTALDSLTLTNLNVRVEGNTAVVTGINHVRGRDDSGRPFDVRVAFTDTFTRRNGRWLVLASQGTVIP